jgi:hypothetical protein
MAAGDIVGVRIDKLMVLLLDAFLFHHHLHLLDYGVPLTYLRRLRKKTKK